MGRRNQEAIASQPGASHFGFWILDFGLGDCLWEPVSEEAFPSVKGNWRKWDAPSQPL